MGGGAEWSNWTFPTELHWPLLNTYNHHHTFFGSHADARHYPHQCPPPPPPPGSWLAARIGMISHLISRHSFLGSTLVRFYSTSPPDNPAMSPSKGLFDLILYVQVNNFSVMSKRVFLGWTNTKLGLMSCSRTQRNVAGEAQTHNPSILGQALHHWATALPLAK